MPSPSKEAKRFRKIHAARSNPVIEIHKCWCGAPLLKHGNSAYQCAACGKVV